MSGQPEAATKRADAASVAGRSARSTVNCPASARCAMPAASRSAPNTRAPAAMKRSTSAEPMPPPAPVISTLRPSRRKGSGAVAMAGLLGWVAAILAARAGRRQMQILAFAA